MTEPNLGSSSDIDDAASNFCAILTMECGRENKEKFAKWSAADLVDNVDPLGWHDSYRLLGRTPGRTFRYGMPELRLPGRPPLFFTVSTNPSSSSRTPQEQAEQVVKGRSKVCWGAHMSNKARHVIPHVDGHAFTDGGKFEVALGNNLQWFIAIWKHTLMVCGLRDAAGGTNWISWDQLHVELPGAKIPQSDPRAMTCVDEYVRLINAGTGKRNHDMEKELQPHLRARLQTLK